MLSLIIAIGVVSNLLNGIKSKFNEKSTGNLINLVWFSKTTFINNVKLNSKNKMLTNIDKIEHDIQIKEKESHLNDFLSEDVEKLAEFLYQTSIKR